MILVQFLISSGNMLKRPSCSLHEGLPITKNYPTISNGITLHPLSGGLGGVGAVSGKAVSMKLPILSAAWSCIWFVTWVYVSSVKPAL